MPIRSRIAVAAAVASLVLPVATGALAAGRVAVPCRGSMLAGTFRAVRGSAGAGNISYRLALRNSSTAACFVTGVPTLTLLDSRGKALPTSSRFAGRPGMLTAVMVPLAPGHTAHLTARFSPDVPGPGEPVTGRTCERTAYKIRVVTSGGGATLAPITPPTPVCEHGTMTLTVLTG